jgi:hypothetical protein
VKGEGDLDTTDLTVPTTGAEARLAELLRQSTAILIASLITGLLVGGVGARIFMLIARLLAPEKRGFITEAEARVGEVTAIGSLFLILFIGVFAAIAIGVMIFVSGPWTAWAGTFTGPVVGVLLLVTFNALVLDPGNFDFALLGDEVPTVAMIAMLFVACGVGAVWLRNRFLGSLPRHPNLSGMGSGYVPAALLGVVGFLLLIVLLLTVDNRADGAIPTIVSFIVLSLVTVVDRGWWVKEGKESPLAVRVAGYAALLSLTMVGSAQLVTSIDRIVG